MSKPVILRFLADTKQLDLAWRRIQADAAKTGGVLKAFTAAGKGMVLVGRTMSRWVTLPLAVAGGAAVKLAYDFDAAMNQINQLVGASKEQMAKYRDSILALAPVVGKGPTELAKALYFITSSGFKGASALRVLRASAKASAAGLGETMTVADAVTSAVNAYGEKALSAAHATDIMVATVREGKAEPEALAKELGKVIAPAAQLRVKFDEVGAAIAAMTDVGLDAPAATTALRQIFVSIIKPSHDAKEAFKQIGLSAAGLRKEIKEKGLLAAMKDIAKASDGNSNTLSRLFPNVRALTGFLAAMGPHASKTAAIFRELAGTTGDTDKAFKKYADTAQGKFHKAVATLQALGIKIGNVLLPYVIDAVRWIAKMAKKFDELDPKTKKMIGMIALVAAATGPLIYGLGKITLAMTALAKHPLLGTLLLLTQAFIVLYTTNETFRQKVQQVIAVVKDVVGWFKKHHTVIVGLAAVVGTFTAVLVVQRGIIAGVTAVTKLWSAGLLIARGAILTTRVAMWLLNAAFAANPIGIVVAAIAALVVGFIYAWKHSETFRDILKAVWRGVKNAFGEAVAFILQGLKDWFDMWMLVVDAIVSGAAKALGWIPGLGGKLKKANKAFDSWKAGIDDTFDGLIASAKGWGSDVAEGLAAGIRKSTGLPVGAAGDMSRKVAAMARQELDSHSPSRVFMKIGEDVAKGEAIGIRKGTPHVTKAASDQVKELYRTYRDQTKQAAAAQRRYEDSIERAKANGKISKSEKITIRNAKREAAKQAREAARAAQAVIREQQYEANLAARRQRGTPMLALAGSITAGLDSLTRNLKSPVATMAETLAAQIQSQFADRDGAVPEAVQNAMDRLSDFASEVSSFRSSFVGSLTGSADIFSAAMGEGAPAGIEGIKSFLSQQVGKIGVLGADLRTLIQRGLPPSMVQQLAAAGLDALPAAEALAHSSDADFKEILAMQSQVESLSGTISSMAEGAIFGGSLGLGGAAAGTSAQSRSLTVEVSAQTNADPAAIANEIGWTLQTMGY